MPSSGTSSGAADGFSPAAPRSLFIKQNPRPGYKFDMNALLEFRVLTELPFLLFPLRLVGRTGAGRSDTIPRGDKEKQGVYYVLHTMYIHKVLHKVEKVICGKQTIINY